MAVPIKNTNSNATALKGLVFLDSKSSILNEQLRSVLIE